MDESGEQAAASRPHRYDAALASQIELRWQQRWEAEGTFESANPAGPLSDGFVPGKPKRYVLDMFPYASGSGIHVGHPIGYIATDVYARFLRMTGHHVLHAMGYDAFGLPAEQYALSTGQHPQVTTQRNVANMRRQLRRLGMGYDSRRSFETTDPRYYRWTQWIFLQIYNSWVDERTGRARPIADLVAEFSSGQRPVPGSRTWAALSSTEQRALIDIRRLAYIAEEPVNWCPALGTVLANEEVTADGRSDIGDFPVHRRPMRQWMLRITALAERLADDLDPLDWPENVKQMQRNWIGISDGAIIRLPVVAGPGSVEVFTTRPDTLAGATYAVLAPEHPEVDNLVKGAWPTGTPAAWRNDANSPAEAVAAYREAAAQLPDRQRVRAKTGVFTGGYVQNPATGEAMPVFVADYVLMSYGTGAIMAVPAHDDRDRDFAAEFGLPARQVTSESGAYLAAPGPELTGLTEAQAIDAAIGWLEGHGHGRRERRCRLRDWLFSRQRYWGEPVPIVYDNEGQPVPLPESALPVVLPDMADFRPATDLAPDSEPVPPLARAADWAVADLDLGDGVRSYRRELNTMPQWAGSCWYYLRYADPGNDQAFADPVNERYWMSPDGVDLYVGGIEHAVLHLLYARFWHKVLYDLGLVSTAEPFARLVNQGMIQADAFTDDRGMYVPADQVMTDADGTPRYEGQAVTRRTGKMGKSLKNGVSPDEMYERFGADTLRLYEMAMGPIEAGKPWHTDDIVGVHRFLQRLWRALVDEQTGMLTVTAAEPDEATIRALHRTIAAVRTDFGLLRFNTAIARLFELTAVAARVSSASGALPRSLAEPLVLMVAPLAPHIAEELWARLGHSQSLAYAPFPVADPDLARAVTITIPVQINGRTRYRIEAPSGATEDELRAMATAHPGFGAHVPGGIARMVIVPDRIVNIIPS